MIRDVWRHPIETTRAPTMIGANGAANASRVPVTAKAILQDSDKETARSGRIADADKPLIKLKHAPAAMGAFVEGPRFAFLEEAVAD